MKALLLPLALLLATPFVFAEDPLPRRGSIGTAVAPLDEAMRDKVPGGVLLRAVFPHLAADNAGLKPGMIVTKVDDAPVATPNDFVARVAGRKTGQHVIFEVLDAPGAQPRRVEVTVTPFPFERSEEYDVLYDSVPVRDFRVRTIATKPHGAGPFPTLLIVHGVGCASVDNPPNGGGYTELIRDLSRRGIATLRMEKPGVGDSQGGPCASADFNTEVEAFKAAAASLPSRPYVDMKNVFILGHSMGGPMGPFIAAAVPTKGFIAYGTTYGSWLEYTLSNSRRQQRLGGAKAVEIAKDEHLNEQFGALFYIQKQSLPDILAAHPEFREWFPDGRTFTAGKEGKYFQQIYDAPIAEAWAKLPPMRLLAVHGGADFLSGDADHQALVDAFNDSHPGMARFVRLEGTDHWLHLSKDELTSYRGGPGASGDYNPEVSKLFGDFILGTK